MSYTVKQFRRTQLSETDYKTPISYTMGTVTTTSGGVSFSDVNISASLSASQSYYLVFTVAQKDDSVQDFTIKLTSSTSDSYQVIDTLSCPIGKGTQTYEFIFTPSMAYDEVVFELARISADYINGRVAEIEVSDFSAITDIMGQLGTTEIQKIGIQGVPGQLMCINGEQIRIGRSGIYEIDNGYSITSIGFIVKKSSTSTDGLDYFTIDYQY